MSAAFGVVVVFLLVLDTFLINFWGANLGHTFEYTSGLNLAAELAPVLAVF